MNIEKLFELFSDKEKEKIYSVAREWKNKLYEKEAKDFIANLHYIKMIELNSFRKANKESDTLLYLVRKYKLPLFVAHFVIKNLE